MKPLSDIVAGLNVKDHPVKNQSIYDAVQENWDEIFGHLAKTLNFGYVKRQSLVVYTKNPAWVNEIGYYEKSFLAKINGFIEHKKYQVTSLTVHIHRKSTAKKKRKPKLVQKSGRSLEENIRHARIEREKLGYKPCTKCGIVLSLKEICAFCKAV